MDGLEEEDCLSCDEAAQLVRELHGTTVGRAMALVRTARKSGDVRCVPTRHWVIFGDQLFPPPSEADILLSKDDLMDWLSRHPDLSTNKTSPDQQKRRSRRRRNEAKEAIETHWPDGVPQHVRDVEVCHQVSKMLKADKRPIPSDDTILRAAGRKK